MGMRVWKTLLMCSALAAPSPAVAATAPIGVVAAENFYGDVASQIGKGETSVASIMANPDQDPHLFEASPSTARLVAGAQVAIMSGADYDPWMRSLLSASSSKARVLEVAGLVGKRPGDNPHIWYDPATMATFADAYAQTLATIEPSHNDAFLQAAAAFRASLAPLERKITAMRAKYAGTPVAASEPVFGYMADRLGLSMREQRFQIAVMNNSEPSSSDVAAFEKDLRDRVVKVMIVNSQADDPAVRKLADLARSAHIPLTSVSELEPQGMTYQRWMLHQLDDLDRALTSDAR
jgi:zinc/manganese transport system substrate-binding protein